MKLITLEKNIEGQEAIWEGAKVVEVDISYGWMDGLTLERKDGKKFVIYPVPSCAEGMAEFKIKEIVE